VPLANLIGIIFQIRDDYVNLQSVEVRLGGQHDDLLHGAAQSLIDHCISTVRQQQRLL
jgi:geranylgeranyl diphosphate synthase, type III